MAMAERIKERRTFMGYTQEELGEKLGLQKSAIAKYENGRVENIKRSVIANMANLLECSPSYLMGWDADEHSKEASPKIMQYYDQLNDMGKHEAEKRVAELTHLPQYTLELKAAHNDHIDEPGELERMQEDIANLKRPDSDT